MAITIYFLLLFFVRSAWSQVATLDYLNWQQEGSIKSGSSKSPLITTNQALCLGGVYRLETASTIFFTDGCLFYGTGRAGSEKSIITYKQTDLETYGAKTSIGMGRFVSSSKTELGFKIPLLYVNQTLGEPDQSSIHQPPSFEVMVSLYSRWHFNQFLVQTEFGKFLGNDLILFSLGLGFEL